MWKIISLADDSPVKLGFETEEEALTWLDKNPDIDESEINVAEMNEEEEEDFLENQEPSVAIEANYDDVDYNEDAMEMRDKGLEITEDDDGLGNLSINDDMDDI